MISAEIYPLGASAGGLTLDVRVTVQSDADGIASVRLQDRRGFPLMVFANLECARFHSFEVTRISREQLPLFVLADECSQGKPGGEPRILGPFNPGTTGPNGTRMCPPPELNLPPSQQCNDARNRAAQLQNEYRMICGRVQNLRWRLSDESTNAAIYHILAAAMFAMVVILIAAGAALTASGFGIVFAAIAYGLAVAAAFAAGYFEALAISFTVRAARTRRELDLAVRELEAKAEQFYQAAMNVRQSCCPGEFFDSDITLPSCTGSRP